MLVHEGERESATMGERMPRARYKLAGESGEQFVVERIPCPHCGGRLQQLPQSYPLFDVQCTSCLFRARVKSPGHKPGSRVRGAGWKILSGALRTGTPVPPLIVNFQLKESGTVRREVRFYPFIPRKNLRHRALSRDPEHPRAQYRMFDYVGLDDLPSLLLLEEGRVDD